MKAAARGQITTLSTITAAAEATWMLCGAGEQEAAGVAVTWFVWFISKDREVCCESTPHNLCEVQAAMHWGCSSGGRSCEGVMTHAAHR